MLIIFLSVARLPFVFLYGGYAEKDFVGMIGEVMTTLR